MKDEREYRLDELAEAARVSPRTVRYYIAEGLVPSPGRLGPNTRYGADHLARLRLIKRLQEMRLPLAEIRQHLEGRTDAPAARVAEALSMRPAAPPPPMASSVTYATADRWSDRSRWERITLAPDIELHVRHPHSGSTDRLVDELVRVARRPERTR